MTPVPAGAQDMGWGTIIPSVTGTDTLGLALREQMQERDPDEATAVDEDGEKAQDAASLRFAVSSTRRKANLARFLEKSRAVDPTGAAELAALFASTDLIGLIDQLMRQQYGMRADNLADAYAVWWTSAWMGAQGRSDDPTQVQMEAVKEQAAEALTSTPQFAHATDATKQEMAEALLIQAALIGASVDAAKGDRKQLDAVGAAVTKGARGMGLDLDKMTLTDDGFRSTKETGALDAEPSVLAAETAIADDGPPYLLMAAAGGAGLGGAYLLGRWIGRKT